MSLPKDYNMGVLGELFEQSKVVIAALLLTAGVGMLIVGILAATTDVFTSFLGLGVQESWRLAGVLAGLGMPMMIVGVFTVLPATKHQRLGAAAGLGVVVIGVLLFALNYPHHWYGDTPDNTFLVVSVYFLGALLTITYLFVSVANLQTPPTTQPSTARRKRVSRARQTQTPQTTAQLLKGILGLALNRGASDAPSTEPEIEYDVVQDRLTEDLGEQAAEIEQVDGHLVVERAMSVSHAQFTTSLPQYVDLVDRDGRKYALAVDAVSFRLLE